MAKKEMLIEVNFEELDAAREKVKQIVERIKGTRLYAYERSEFYIGRGLTRFSFHNINVNVMQMKKILYEVSSTLPIQYNVVRLGSSLHIYPRGLPRNRR